MSKSAKNTGTKTKSTTALARTQAKAAKRVGKITAKHEAIRKAGQPVKPAPAVETVSMEQKVASAAGDALAQPAASNPLLTARGSAFTDALNAATVEQLEEALKHPGMSNQQRNRIGIALKLRSAPADDVAKTVAAVESGDLTKGVEVPTADKKKPAAKAAKPEGKMSGLDAAARVLAESPEPLNAKQIVEQAAAQGYWSSNAATPHATIYSAIITEIAKKGADSRFKKTDRGLFTATDAAKQGK